MDAGVSLKVPSADTDAADLGVASQKQKKGKFELRQEDELKRMNEFLSVLSKLTLSSALAVRTHRSIIIDCMELPTENRFIKAHRAGTGRFTEAAKALREKGVKSEQVKEQLGIPGVHGTNEMVGLYIAEKLPMYKKMEEAILLWRSQAGWRTIDQHIRHSRVSKMYHSNVKRLEISAPLMLTLQTITPGVLDEDKEPEASALTPTWAMCKILQQIRKEQGFRALEGLAPMGDLERRVQDFIDTQDQK